MFGLKGRDTFNKPTSNFGDILKKTGKWWIKLFPYFLTLLIVICIVVMGYVWYTYLYNKDVTEEEKQQYIDKKNKEVTFKKEKFNELKNEIILRKERFEENRIEYEDIFYHTKKDIEEDVVDEMGIIEENIQTQK